MRKRFTPNNEEGREKESPMRFGFKSYTRGRKVYDFRAPGHSQIYTLPERSRQSFPPYQPPNNAQDGDFIPIDSGSSSNSRPPRNHNSFGGGGRGSRHPQFTPFPGYYDRFGSQTPREMFERDYPPRRNDRSPRQQKKVQDMYDCREKPIADFIDVALCLEDPWEKLMKNFKSTSQKQEKQNDDIQDDAPRLVNDNVASISEKFIETTENSSEIKTSQEC